MNHTNTKPTTSPFVNVLVLFFLNILMMLIIAHLTLEVQANQNSRIGAFLLSFFIPVFVVLQTQTLSGFERMMKFGFGFMAYSILTLVYVGLAEGIKTGVFPCLTVSLAVLYFGNHLMHNPKR